LNKYTLPEIENKRLQRLRAKLDHLQFHAVWIKGKDNTEADVLSRIPYRKAEKDNIVDNEDDSVSASMIATVDLFKGSNFDYMATPLRDEQLLELRAHQDENYEHLKTTIIKDGWPDKQIDLHPDLETFWSHRDDLSIDNDGFIVKNGHLLVPAGLCQTYLQRMLAMHQQAEKMEARARKSICSHSSQETSRTLPKRVYPVKKSYQARHRSRNAPTRKHTTHSTPCTRISRATKNDNS
jgi:hypothetical protein